MDGERPALDKVRYQGVALKNRSKMALIRRSVSTSDTKMTTSRIERNAMLNRQRP
jgi:hypothetical protein